MPKNKQKSLSDVNKLKHFLLGAGLMLIVAFTTSSVFAQTPPAPPNVPLQTCEAGKTQCSALQNQCALPMDCFVADTLVKGIHTYCPQAQVPNVFCKPFYMYTDVPAGVIPAGISQNMLPFPGKVFCLGTGQVTESSTECDRLSLEKTNIPPLQPQQQMPPPQQQPQQQFQQNNNSQNRIQQAIEDVANIERDISLGNLKLGQSMPSCIWSNVPNQMVNDCLNAAKAVAAGQTIPGVTQSQQQPLFGQQQFGQQQPQPKIVAPTIRGAGATLASKGLKLALKMQTSLDKTYSKAKGRTKKLATVRSIAKKLPTLCRYISSGDEEVDLDEDAFNCDIFVAELSEPIGDALKAKDYEVAYESTIAALGSFGQLFESIK